jgi:hypothetical protein
MFENWSVLGPRFSFLTAVGLPVVPSCELRFFRGCAGEPFFPPLRRFCGDDIITRVVVWEGGGGGGLLPRGD